MARGSLFFSFLKKGLGGRLSRQAKQRSAPPKKHGAASRRPRPSAESAPLFFFWVRPCTPAAQRMRALQKNTGCAPTALFLLLLWRGFIYSKLIFLVRKQRRLGAWTCANHCRRRKSHHSGASGVAPCDSGGCSAGCVLREMTSSAPSGRMEPPTRRGVVLWDWWLRVFFLSV
jgi:hypothetical protein